MSLTESQYDWARLPEDLPHKNLVLITAKTPHPTFHKEDAKRPIRLFTTQELLEASRSLAHRQIGLNHLGDIQGAFTVDAQYNPTTGNVEALCFFPDEWIDKVRELLNEGKESIFSIEYTWRDTKDTAEGVEFVGLIFDKVDLLCGINAGDRHTSARLVESAISFTGRRAYCEAQVAYPELIQSNNIDQSVANPSQDFFKECQECHTLIKDGKCECNKAIESTIDENLKPLSPIRKEDKNPNAVLGLDEPPIPKQRPEETNLLNNEPFTPVVNQDPPRVDKPIMNVMSAGFVEDSKGPVGVGGKVGDKPKFGMSGSTVPRTSDDKKMLGPDDKGQSANAETTYVQGTKNIQNQDVNAGMVAGVPLGASTSTENPIPEEFKTVKIKGTGKECDNPINEGLNTVNGPDNSNEDTYNKVESNMSEKPKEEKKEEKKEEPKKEEPKQEQSKETKLTEAQLTIALHTIEEKDAKIATLSTENSTLKGRVVEVEGAHNKSQEFIKTADTRVAEAEQRGYVKGKKEVISKFREVIPENTLVSGMSSSYRALLVSANKALKEAQSSLI